MEKRIYIPISLLCITGLALEACGPQNAQAKAEDSATHTFEPTDIPSKQNSPAAGYMANIDKPGPIATIEPIEIAPIAIDLPYFSQLDPIYKQMYFQDGSTWAYSGCDVLTGAMLDRTDPPTYYRDFLAYFASIGKDGAQRFSKKGSDFRDLVAVLSSKGHTFIELSKGDHTKFADVNDLIKRYVNQGIPVFIRGSIWDGFNRKGHMLIAVGVNENGEIVTYDSVYGQNAVLDESKYFQELPGKDIELDSYNSLKVFAVFPPGTFPPPQE